MARAVDNTSCTPSDRKEELRTLIVDGGGEYMGAMEARRTTHLVAEVGSHLCTLDRVELLHGIYAQPCGE